MRTVEEKAAGVDIPADVRRQADAASLAAIRRLIARQYDKPAWCRTMAEVIDGGAYDVDRRSDLDAALKRIFGKEIGAGLRHFFIPRPLREGGMERTSGPVYARPAMRE